MLREETPMRTAASAWVYSWRTTRAMISLSKASRFFEATLDVEDEDECVFKGTDFGAGGPAPAYRVAEDVGRAAYLHGGVEVAS